MFLTASFTFFITSLVLACPSKLGFFTRGIERNPINHFKNFEIYDIKAYNKMLSDEEILINYNNLIKNGVIVNE